MFQLVEGALIDFICGSFVLQNHNIGPRFTVNGKSEFFYDLRNKIMTSALLVKAFNHAVIAYMNKKCHPTR